MKLLLLHLPYHDPKQGRIIMQKETVIQKKAGSGGEDKRNKTHNPNTQNPSCSFPLSLPKAT